MRLRALANQRPGLLYKTLAPRGTKAMLCVGTRGGEYGVDDEKPPWAKRRSEQRKRDAALRYDLEMESRKVGWRDPALIYDEEKNLFRFRDGRFAFSREHAIGLS